MSCARKEYRGAGSAGSSAGEPPQASGPVHSLSVLLGADVELLHLVEERGALHPAQAPRRLGLVSAMRPEGSQDQLPLRVVLRAGRGARRAPCGAERNQLGSHHVPVLRESNRALDRALQLLHVPGPRMAPELGPRVTGERDALPRLRARALEEVLPDQLDILDPVAERWNLEP